MIGIVGGVGPYSGIDLLKKVCNNTKANCDQDHIDAVLLSVPASIADRTEYLVGKVKVNPAIAIAAVLLKLEKTGATIAGIPCNTAHAEKIFQVIQSELEKAGSTMKIVHMIDETVAFIASTYPNITKVGVLSTTGTYQSGLYAKALQAKGYEAIVPTPQMQETVIHPAIYHPVYGIKAITDTAYPQARENLLQGMSFLQAQGAEAVILGCTEIPLAITEQEVEGIITIDPTNVLARQLIYSHSPDKLKSL